MAELTLNDMRKTWDEYLHDDTYTDIGKLNLAAWLGQRTGFLLDRIDKLQDEGRAAVAEAVKAEREACANILMGRVQRLRSAAARSIDQRILEFAAMELDAVIFDIGARAAASAEEEA